VDVASIELVKRRDRHVNFLELEEISALFAILDTDSIIGKRDAAILQTIYSTGLRISELVALNRQDVNTERLEFAVRGKGGKIRVVYLTNKSAEAIDIYLRSRNDHFSPLFIRHNYDSDAEINLSDKQVRLSRFFITEMVKKTAIKA
jgi:site-specific recombinase XerD